MLFDRDLKLCLSLESDAPTKLSKSITQKIQPHNLCNGESRRDAVTSHKLSLWQRCVCDDGD